VRRPNGACTRLRDRSSHLVPATDEPVIVRAVDFVLFCAKLSDVESAGIAIRQLVGPARYTHPIPPVTPPLGTSIGRRSSAPRRPR
jgi:hypothetical protein